MTANEQELWQSFFVATNLSTSSANELFYKARACYAEEKERKEKALKECLEWLVSHKAMDCHSLKIHIEEALK